MEKIDLIEIVKHSDHYVIANKGVYFKIGLNEGSILKKIQEGVSLEQIAQEKNVTVEAVKDLIRQLEEAGVIGEVKKQKFNPLFIKIPVIQADTMFEKMIRQYRERKKIFNVIFICFNLIMIAGLTQFCSHVGSIFTIGNVKLRISQYILLYGIFMFCYTILRINTGGFHCRNHIICITTYSVLAFFGISLFMFMKHYIVFPYFCVLCLAIGIFLIIKLCPVASVNKEISESLKIQLRKKGIVSVLAISFVVLVLLVIHRGEIIICSATAAVIVQSCTLLPVFNKLR